MRTARLFRRCLACWLAICLPLVAIIGTAAEKPGRFARGRELFVREWQANDPASPAGDGLGPMFNARSCVACHNQGGVGGGGANDHNVDLLSVELPPEAKQPGGLNRNALSNSLEKVHRGLLANVATTVLHTSSTDALYREWRDALAPPLPAEPAPPVRVLNADNGVKLQLSQRNTPALFGAAAIDSLADGLLKQVAAEQRKRHPKTAGRVASRGLGQPEGRFGWRGQIATLDDFVRGACAAEVGLQLPGHAQSENPRVPHQSVRGPDMSETDVRHLVKFVASLPQPRQEIAGGPQLVSTVKRGELMFKTIGCAACHMRSLGTVHGIYSDLLLHDMGENLADLGANGMDTPASGISSYYGGAASIFVYQPDAKKQREWRTPPLWGVRDSAPYLHDGRAATLRDAIVMHGGQGEAAARNFAVLASEQQSQLLLFLNSLAAPEQDTEL